MPFEIDVVSEFTYFENLTLGLANALHKCVGVKKTNLKKFGPLLHQQIKEWETNQGVTLPEEIRIFYLSSDGYDFEWTYALENNQTTIGRVNINSIGQLAQVYGYETTNNPGINLEETNYTIRLAPESKLFELASTPSGGKVVLVYLYPTNEPSIWFMSTDKALFYLTNRVGTYLRMAIAHLGIPNWQFKYTTLGLPQWSKNMFDLLHPDLLNDGMLEKWVRNKIMSDNDYVNIPINQLNPIVFDPNNYIETEILFPEIPVLEPEEIEKYLKVEKVRSNKRRTIRQRKKKEKSLKLKHASTFSLSKF